MDWTISEMKERGKTAFKANYWKCVVVAVILSVLLGGTSAMSSGGRSFTQNSGQNITSETKEEDADISEVADSATNALNSVSPMTRGMILTALSGFILIVLIQGGSNSPRLAA